METDQLEKYYTFDEVDERRHNNAPNEFVYVHLGTDELFTGVIKNRHEIHHIEDGLYHRLDGPAYIDTRHGTYDWFIREVKYTFDEFVNEAGWTDEQIVEWKLTHG